MFKIVEDQEQLFITLVLIAAVNAGIGGWYYLRMIAIMYLRESATAPAVAYVPCTAMMFNGPLIEIDPTCVAKS